MIKLSYPRIIEDNMMIEKRNINSSNENNKYLIGNGVEPRLAPSSPSLLPPSSSPPKASSSSSTTTNLGSVGTTEIIPSPEPQSPQTSKSPIFMKSSSATAPVPCSCCDDGKQQGCENSPTHHTFNRSSPNVHQQAHYRHYRHSSSSSISPKSPLQQYSPRSNSSVSRKSPQHSQQQQQHMQHSPLSHHSDSILRRSTSPPSLRGRSTNWDPIDHYMERSQVTRDELYNNRDTRHQIIRTSNIKQDSSYYVKRIHHNTNNRMTEDQEKHRNRTSSREALYMEKHHRHYHHRYYHNPYDIDNSNVVRARSRSPVPSPTKYNDDSDNVVAGNRNSNSKLPSLIKTASSASVIATRHHDTSSSPPPFKRMSSIRSVKDMITSKPSTTIDDTTLKNRRTQHKQQDNQQSADVSKSTIPVPLLKVVTPATQLQQQQLKLEEDSRSRKRHHRYYKEHPRDHHSEDRHLLPRSISTVYTAESSHSSMQGRFYESRNASPQQPPCSSDCCCEPRLGSPSDSSPLPVRATAAAPHSFLRYPLLPPPPPQRHHSAIIPPPTLPAMHVPPSPTAAAAMQFKHHHPYYHHNFYARPFYYGNFFFF